MAYSTFIDFRNYVNDVVQSNNLATFKESPIFTEILEHKNFHWGKKFYDLIQEKFQIPVENIVEFCKKNDSIGSPEIHEFPFGKASSNSVKYIYHANLALQHAKSLGETTLDCVEIGGGYGGMALAICYFAPKYDITIRSYKMIDFPELIQLQEKYLEQNLKDISHFSFHSTFQYGNDIQDKNLFLIAIYSLGELSVVDKEKYIQEFIPKTNHGFIIWNAEPFMSLHKNETVSEEVPQTGAINRFIFF